MKPLDVVKHLDEALNGESRQAALNTLILAQIQGLEKLIENNGAHVKSALAYNHCVGLIAQLKFYALAAFQESEQNLEIKETFEGEK